MTKSNQKVSNKLKKIVLEKYKLLADLNDACVVCDALKSGNSMLVDKVKSLENELNDYKKHF
jgi:chaperonin cofactor prefoldin